MNIHVGHWVIPVILTGSLWIYLKIKFPDRPSQGKYDFGIEYVFAFFVGVIGTLIIWLAYFASLYFLTK